MAYGPDSVVVQVKCIQFHPMQPWLASVDEAGAVSVWDLSARQQIYETKLSTPDDVTIEDFMLQRAAEKEKDFFGAHTSQVSFVKCVKGCWGSLRVGVSVLYSDSGWKARGSD